MKPKGNESGGYLLIVDETLKQLGCVCGDEKITKREVVPCVSQKIRADHVEGAVSRLATFSKGKTLLVKCGGEGLVVHCRRKPEADLFQEDFERGTHQSRKAFAHAVTLA